jgi:2-polyprenyl-6-methoxyphenol hydroxylase-like FAD-dependent oxidoreductase
MVIVVGAGPTGLVLACALRAAGVPVRVLDSAGGPAVTSRAIALRTRAIEVLARLDALEDLFARGRAVHRALFCIGGRSVVNQPVGLSLLIPQTEVEAALRARYDGEIEWNSPVRTVRQDADRVTVGLADGREVTGEWVVGCDGAQSVVRRWAGIGFPGVPLVERFLIADVQATLDRPRDAVSVWLDGAEALTAFPLPGKDRWRLMARARLGATGDAAVQTRQRIAHSGGEVRTAEWTTLFQIHRRLADSYRNGRVLIAGDAAHVHNPLTGFGLSTGMGDAENLAWKLALVTTGRARESLLDTYEAERRPAAATTVATIGSVTEALATSKLVRFVVLLKNRRTARQHLSYRCGPLANRRTGHLVADIPAQLPDGTVTRLYGHLGAGWALLDARPGLVEVAKAALGAVTELAAGGRDSLLVRPDGHLAWRGTDPAGLTRRLTDVLRATPVPAGIA